MLTGENVHGSNFKTVQQVVVQNKLLFTEAKKLVDMAAPTMVDKSCAAVPKVATKMFIDTDLTWHVDVSKR